MSGFEPVTPRTLLATSWSNIPSPFKKNVKTQNAGDGLCVYGGGGWVLLPPSVYGGGGGVPPPSSGNPTPLARILYI